MTLPDGAPPDAHWICLVCSGAAVAVQAVMLLGEEPLERRIRRALDPATPRPGALTVTMDLGDVQITRPVIIDSPVRYEVTKITVNGRDVTGQVDVVQREDWDRWQQALDAGRSEEGV